MALQLKGKCEQIQVAELEEQARVLQDRLRAETTARALAEGHLDSNYGTRSVPGSLFCFK